jgi:Domain of unknown function (DUF3473)
MRTQKRRLTPLPCPHTAINSPSPQYSFKRHAHLIQTPSGPITEVPIATAKLWDDRVVPVGGGGYMRLLPYRYTSAGIRRINSQEQMPACIYFHPWELDPGQPRLELGFVSRLRTYGGLASMPGKLERLLDEFHFSTLLDLYPVPARNHITSGFRVSWKIVPAVADV